MKISFLVTYYQQERFVRQSMDSILAIKKPEEWEILVGDDGSTDGTVQEVQKYIDRDPEHIRLWVMSRDPKAKYNSVQRASANRLNLVRHATGDCYCLMDGDDFYTDTEFALDAIKILNSSSEGSVIGFDTWMYQDGTPVEPRRKGKEKTAAVPRKRYLRWQYTHAGACVIRNDFSAEKLQMLEKLGSFDDNDIVMNALTYGKLIRINRPVYAYRQTNGSVYSSMNLGERAALNVVGMGAGLKIMGPVWTRDVEARFATAVWIAWFMRKTLRGELPEQKYQSYLNGCRKADFKWGEKLLSYPELKKDEQKLVRKWVCKIGKESPPRVLYALLQTGLWMAAKRKH